MRKIEISEQPTTLVGSLVKTEYIDIGYYQKCLIQKLISTDLISGQQSIFVRLDLTVNETYGEVSKIAALTFNQVDGLINSLIAFRDKVIITNPSVYTEVNYVTEGFKAGCYYANDKWSVYLKLIDRDDKSYIFTPFNTIDQLIALLENTKISK